MGNIVFEAPTCAGYQQNHILEVIIAVAAIIIVIDPDSVVY